MDKSRGTAKKSAETDIELLEMNVLKVKEGLTNILKNFFQVGYTLSVIQDSKGFKSKQYKSFIIFTNAEFGLSKDQTYRMINIYKKFSQDNKYLNYSFGQLTEMLTIPVSKLNDVNETMSTNEIRIIKKKINTETENEVIEFGDQIKVIDVIPEEVVKIESKKKEKEVDRVKELEAGVKALQGRLENSKLVYDRLVERDNLKIKELQDKVKLLESENGSLLSKLFDSEKDYKFKINVAMTEKEALVKEKKLLEEQVQEFINDRKSKRISKADKEKSPDVGKK